MYPTPQHNPNLVTDPSLLDVQNESLEPIGILVEANRADDEATADLGNILETPTEELAVVSSPDAEAQKRGKGFVEWVKNNKKAAKAWIAAGTLAVASVGVTIAETAAKSSWGDLGSQTLETSLWAVPSGISTEGLFITGAGMMLASAFGEKGRQLWNRIKHPRRNFDKLRDNILESNIDQTKRPLLERPLFKAGFAINAIGSIATAAVWVAAWKQMPPEAWGVAPLGFVDMGLTVAIRAAIVVALKAGKPIESLNASDPHIAAALESAAADRNRTIPNILQTEEI